MADNDTKYLIDTDALSNIRRHQDGAQAYSEVFRLAKDGIVKTVRQVIKEIERHKPVHLIVAPHKMDLLVPNEIQYSEEVQKFIEIVGTDAGHLYEATGGSDPADPWLIAVAKAEGYTLVTDESRTSGKKIPAACKLPRLICPCISSPHFLFNIGIVTKINPEHIDPSLFYPNSR